MNHSASTTSAVSNTSTNLLMYYIIVVLVIIYFSLYISLLLSSWGFSHAEIVNIVMLVSSSCTIYSSTSIYGCGSEIRFNFN